MKNAVKKSALTITIIVVLLFTLNLLTMRSIRTEIEINASAKEVWNVLMNHQSYHEWNPFIKKISGSTNLGESFEVTIQSGEKDPMKFKPIVLVNKVNQEFRWVGKLGIKGVFDGEHYFILEQAGPNQTKFIHGENFTGLLSGLLMMMIGKDTERGFNEMNKAIKLRVEGN